MTSATDFQSDHWVVAIPVEQLSNGIRKVTLEASNEDMTLDPRFTSSADMFALRLLGEHARLWSQGYWAEHHRKPGFAFRMYIDESGVGQ